MKEERKKKNQERKCIQSSDYGVNPFLISRHDSHSTRVYSKYLTLSTQRYMKEEIKFRTIIVSNQNRKTNQSKNEEAVCLHFLPFS